MFLPICRFLYLVDQRSLLIFFFLVAFLVLGLFIENVPWHNTFLENIGFDSSQTLFVLPFFGCEQWHRKVMNHDVIEEDRHLCVIYKREH